MERRKPIYKSIGLSILSLLMVACASASTPAEKVDKDLVQPNILVILADDLPLSLIHI